jgi:hypothetical protein
MYIDNLTKIISSSPKLANRVTLLSFLVIDRGALAADWTRHQQGYAKWKYLEDLPIASIDGSWEDPQDTFSHHDNFDVDSIIGTSFRSLRAYY